MSEKDCNFIDGILCFDGLEMLHVCIECCAENIEIVVEVRKQYNKDINKEISIIVIEGVKHFPFRAVHIAKRELSWIGHMTFSQWKAWAEQASAAPQAAVWKMLYILKI